MKLSALISDGLVLQRGKDNYVWGSECKPDAVIEVTLDGKHVVEQADGDGKFKIKLPEVEVGGSYVMTIYECEADTVKIENILCGDVFLLAGQSNIELPLSRCLDLHGEEISKMDLPKVHSFEVAKEYKF